jgi:hypothetical protein
MVAIAAGDPQIPAIAAGHLQTTAATAAGAGGEGAETVAARLRPIGGTGDRGRGRDPLAGAGATKRKTPRGTGSAV